MNLQKLFICPFVLVASSCIAQVQFGFGNSPGFCIAKAESGNDNLKACCNYSLSPHLLLNYLHRKSWGGTLKVSLTGYGISLKGQMADGTHRVTTDYPKLEPSISIFLKKPIVKKVSWKVFAGSAIAFPIYYAHVSDKSVAKEMLNRTYNSNPDLYAISGTGIIVTLPGRNTHLDLNVDYHFGLANRITQIWFTYEAQTLTGKIQSRLSYMQVNIDLVFGREKTNSKHKLVVKRNSVF